MLINLFDKVRLGILLLASLLGHFQIGGAALYSRQCDNSMDSDEELRLITEVDELQSQLKHAGDSVDPILSGVFYRSLENKSTAERIPKWMTRIKTLRERLENHSGRAAVSPVVAHHDQTQKDRKRKAPNSPPEPEIQSHVAGTAVQVRGKNKYAYTEHVDGSPPIMCPLHVDFIRMSVDEMKKDENITKLGLLTKWNAANSAQEHKRLTKSIFSNNYITLQNLLRISKEELPLPVPYDAKAAWPSDRVKIEGESRRGRPRIVRPMSGQRSDGESDR